MVKKKVRVGLIGAGAIAQHHCRVIRAIDWIEFAGIMSRTKSKAQALAKEYGIPCCEDTVESLIRQTNPDALMLFVSADQMCTVAASVMTYGIPVFIEKPAGISVEENELLIKSAKKNNIKTMVGYNRRYYSVFHKGMEMVKQKGPLLGISIEGHERLWRIRDSHAYSEEILNQWIFVNSTHTIDLLRLFGGEITNLKSISHGFKEKSGDQFAAVMETESGALGVYHANWYSPGGWKVVLYGDGITVKFDPLEKGSWTNKKFETGEIIPDDIDTTYKPGFYRQMENFGILVRDGKTSGPLLDLEGSLQTMKLAEKISHA